MFLVTVNLPGSRNLFAELSYVFISSLLSLSLSLFLSLCVSLWLLFQNIRHVTSPATAQRFSTCTRIVNKQKKASEALKNGHIHTHRISEMNAILRYDFVWRFLNLGESKPTDLNGLHLNRFDRSVNELTYLSSQHVFIHSMIGDY